MTAPGAFSSGDVLTAADMNGLAGGVVGYDKDTSPPTLSTSEQVLASVTFTAVSGRLYLAIANMIAVSFNAAGVLTQKIYNPTRIAEGVFPAPSTSLDYVGATVSGYFTASGSVTVEQKANLFGGATSATVGTSFDTDPYLMVIDVGPA